MLNRFPSGQDQCAANLFILNISRCAGSRAVDFVETTGFVLHALCVCVFYRADCEHVDNVVHPFDWTFTTDYCGTLLGHDDNVLQVRQV